jgi:hypothetical protein
MEPARARANGGLLRAISYMGHGCPRCLCVRPLHGMQLCPSRRASSPAGLRACSVCGARALESAESVRMAVPMLELGLELELELETLVRCRGD